MVLSLGVEILILARLKWLVKMRWRMASCQRLSQVFIKMSDDQRNTHAPSY